MSRLTKIELEERLNRLYEYLVDGVDDIDAMNELGLNIVEYEKLKRELLDKKAEDNAKLPIEHIYAQYIISQMQNVRDLTSIIDEHKSVSKNPSSAVAAIKTRSDIADKIIARGQEFGLVHRESDKKVVTSYIADLSSEQLKETIAKEMKFLGNVMKEYGESNVIDVDPGDIHVGPSRPELMLDAPKDEKPKDKHNKANTAKKAGGRITKKMLEKKKVKVKVK